MAPGKKIHFLFPGPLGTAKVARWEGLAGWNDPGQDSPIPTPEGCLLSTPWGHPICTQEDLTKFMKTSSKTFCTKIIPSLATRLPVGSATDPH